MSFSHKQEQKQTARSLLCDFGPSACIHSGTRRFQVIRVLIPQAGDMSQAERAQALGEDRDSRHQQDHRDCSGEKRRQGQEVVEQQDCAEESRRGGEEQEAPQSGQREAGFQQRLHLHRADDQVERQRELSGGESGAVKWYAARDYRVSAGDPLTPNYRFLDVNSAVPSQNPWGTNTSQTHEQTYTLIHVDWDTMTFSTYMFRYDGRRDQMITAPYLYDSLILRRDDAARADNVATADPSPGVLPPANYADVPETAWYAEAVNTVSARGLLDTRPGNRFEPGESLTRREVVTALYRLAGMPAASAGTLFPDVPRSSGCYDAVSWAAGAGLVSGMPDGCFSPDAGITRAQLATMLYRYAVYSGTSVAAGSGIGTYADWRQAEPWCREPLSWAMETGLLRGKAGNRLAPGDIVTRAEGVVFLRRLL